MAPPATTPASGDGHTQLAGLTRVAGKFPETITGTGEDELAAMVDLGIRLDERHRAEKLDAIDRRGRAAFLDGAEERSRTVEGRPLTATADELERVTKRYPV